jgi:hypothetical protein
MEEENRELDKNKSLDHLNFLIIASLPPLKLNKVFDRICLSDP